MSSEAGLPTGTVTFLFTDIEGSTQLLKELRSDYAAVLAEHQRIIRHALAAHGGREIDTAGDSFFAAFRRAKDAVGAALDAQRALAEHPWPGDRTLRVRMGIHTGEPTVGDETYIGIGVHRAARISSAGHGGQVLVSQTTRELLRDDPIPDVSLRDLGVHQLKDMDGPESLFQLVAPGLETDFPPPKTAAPSAIEGREGEVVVAARGAVREMAARWRRKRAFTGGAIAGAAVLAAVLGVVFTRGSASASGIVAANSVGVFDAQSGTLQQKVAVGQAPGAVVGGAGAVWVVNSNENSVSRIDPQTNVVIQTISVGAAPSGAAVGGGSVWVANGLAGTLSRISPDTNAVVQTIPVGNGPAGVAYGNGKIWVANAVDGTVSEVEPASGRAIRTVPVANGVSAIAYGSQRVWVVSPSSGEVLALDPTSGEVVDHIGVGVDPDAVATGAGAVWVANRGGGTLARIDPRTLTVTDVIAVGRTPVAVVADARAVWVANAGGGTITKVDPSSVRVVKTVRVDNAPSGLAVTTGGLYVAVRGTGLAHRGGTLRLLTPARYDDLDPAVAYNQTSWSILASTNDGLVGFRRAGGIEGVGIVPDLAASLPAPTDGGKTWTFRLRPNIRYSTGALVQPEDFRRAFQRVFQLRTSPAARFYTDIIGAAECTAARCDLSHGIVTDRAARTVTFRLTAPDVDFLSKLALPFADPVPVSTPARDQTAHPVPATGPYMVASVRGLRVRLVRNPHFHEWSSDAQPAGYPDEIDWNVAQPVPGIHSVVGGKADAYLFLRGAQISKAQLNELATGYPSQLRANPSAVSDSFFLNTREKPFTDVRVRRAVNYAFDRTAFAKLLGRGVEATCQILPPNSASFRRTCPYVPNGAAGLDEARRLVRASGTVGEKVTVWTQPEQTVEGRFMGSVLHSLGYVVSLHTVDDDHYFDRILDTRTHAQVGINGWQADFPSASAFLTVQFACNAWAAADPDRSADPSFFCDPALDRLMARAGQLQVVNPPAAGAVWQQVERRVLRAAPLVPTYNPKAFDFLTRGVGNYQYDPQLGVLVDQLWLK